MQKIKTKIKLTLKILLTTFFVFFALKAKSQINNSLYEKNKDFGIYFAINYSYLKITQNNNSDNDSIINVYNIPKPGVETGFVISYKLTKNLKLNIYPALSFISSRLIYRYNNSLQSEDIEVFTDFTSAESKFCLKYNSKRFNNCNTYFLAGFTPKYFLKSAGQYYTNVEKKLISPYSIQFDNFDFSYECGFGLNIFGQSNIQSVEVVFSSGINNLLIKDISEFTQILNSVKINYISIKYIFNK